MQKLLLATLLAGLLTTAQASSKTPLTEQNSFYISAGYGYPKGLRMEIGYKFERYLTLGGTLSSVDRWSYDPAELKFGAIGKLRLGDGLIKYTPHLSFHYEGSISVFFRGDESSAILLGCSIPIKSWLLAQPELGYGFFDKAVSKHGSFFTGLGEDRSKYYQLIFNLNFEIDFARLYNQ